MLTRCLKGLIVVSSRSFLCGGARKTLLGKLEQDWIRKLGEDVWVDWRHVAEGKCRLPHNRDTVTTRRTEVDPGTTSIVAPTPSRFPPPTVSSPPKLSHRRDTVATGRMQVDLGTAPIATPVPTSPCPPLTPVSSPPKLPQRQCRPVPGQPSEQNEANGVIHGAPRPRPGCDDRTPLSSHAGVPTQPPRNVSNTGK